VGVVDFLDFRVKDWEEWRFFFLIFEGVEPIVRRG
jgi:hypothetical protein